MEKEVSVFKVIMLFILNIILFSIIDLIGYYIIMFIFNILMNNVSIFYNIFIKSIPYILFTIIYSASLGKWSFTFTTSIVISPHKNFVKISQIGCDCADAFTVLQYLAIDFKKKDGFLKTNQLSKKLNLYRQNYCGCEFSKPL